MIKNTSNEPHVSWLLGGNPNAIVAQEKEGQAQLVGGSQLPTDGLSKVTEKLLGVVVNSLSDGDPMFSDVTLPEGWEIKPTDHDMWTTLHDETGKERASMFYKAAFYDRSAFIRLTREA